MNVRLKDGTALAVSIRCADTFIQRFRGLMFSDSFPPQSDGLLLSPCNSVHTMFMRYKLDVLFLDRDGRVLHVIDAMPPWRFSPVVRGARRVLEVSSGTIAQYGVSVGDRLEFINEGKVV